MSKVWQQAIIVGASSGIGAELAKQIAATGCKVALVARRENELRQLADGINQGSGQPLAFAYPHDVTCYEDVPGLFQQITRDLGGLDLIIYASGVMPRVEPNEYAFEKDHRMIEVNVLGAVAWLNEAAQRFERGGAGTLVGISSVAGDRGRRGSPVYGASKAFLNTYLESLRNRIARTGAAVVTVKPGPIDTPMTKGLDKMPFMIPAELAARQILAAARSRKNTAYVPGKWRAIMFIVRSIPSFIFKKMNF